MRGFFRALFLLTALTWMAEIGGPARALADDSKVSRDPASTRSKSIKFEDDVVEGMNKNPMDSAENLGRRDNNQAGHLYHKPTDFKDAVRQTVHEMGKTQ